MIKSALDLPSIAVRGAASKAWNLLPKSLTSKVENFVDNRSWVTRTAIKTVGTAAITGTAVLCAGAATVPVGLAAAALGATIGGRATRITNLWTGKDLPSDPKAPLLETAHKIALFEARNTSASLLRPIAPQVANPPVSDLAAKQAKLTDANLQTFIQNASIATTISLIHTGCLGLEVNPALLPRIIAEASLPDANLWDIYMTHLGQDLSFFQWIYASIVFFFTYSIGIIPNSIKTFMTNILAEGRRNFSDPSQIQHLDQGLRLLLDQASSFLDVYNCATIEYANATNPTGDLDSYRRAAIEGFTGKTLEELTQEFCTSLVDQFFPHIPFFETLKQYPVIGWVFTLLDALIGGIINCVGRKILKYKLPEITLSLMKTGIDSTHPTNLSFTIAITNAITELFRELENTQQDLAETPLLKPEKLPEVIEKLIYTLELNGDRKNPLNMQIKIREQLAKINSSWRIEKKLRDEQRDAIRDAILNSSHTFISHLTKNTEPVFASVLNLLNAPFIEARQPTPFDYENAMQGLDVAAQKAFYKLIHNFLEGVPIEKQREFYQQLFSSYKETTDATIADLQRSEQMLSGASTTGRRMQAIEQYVYALKKLTSNEMIHQVHLAGDNVKAAFYEAFRPLHKELPSLIDQLLDLQTLIQEQKRNHTVEEHLRQMGQTLTILAADPTVRTSAEIPHTLLESLTQIQQSTSHLSARVVKHIQEQIQALQTQIGVVDTSQQEIRRLTDLLVARGGAQEGSWLTRAPSISNLIRPASTVHLEQQLQTQQLQQQQNIKQIQTMIEQFRLLITPLAQTQPSVTQQNSTLLSQRMAVLHETTVRLTNLNQAIQPARVETHPFLRRKGHEIAARVITPYAMNFFEKVYHFITKKDLYDASRRILMQTFVTAYPPK